MRNITLSMIVKNESSNIERCLESVAPYIDYYIICDTGSTDDTKEKIKAFFDSRGISGEIYNHEWEDFGTNRSKALELTYGKTKWALMIDADDSIQGDFPVNNLSDEFDAYYVTLKMGETEWNRTQIFNISKKKWKFVEPLQEYPDCGEPANIGTLIGDYKWLARADGCRSKESQTPSEKYVRDYWLLKSFLKKDPNQPRKQFYAAQSAFDAGMVKVAEDEYIKRTKQDSWIEETYYSWYRIGKCREILGRPLEQVIDAYMMAYETCPDRVEPLCCMSILYRNHNRPKCAFLVANLGSKIKLNSNRLFVDPSDYNWRIHDEIGATAFYAKEGVIGARSCRKLLSENFLPQEHLPRVKSNFELYVATFPEVREMVDKGMI